MVETNQLKVWCNIFSFVETIDNIYSSLCFLAYKKKVQIALQIKIEIKIEPNRIELYP